LTKESSGYSLILLLQEFRFLEGVAFACSSADDHRTALQTISIELGADGWTFAATDGHRLVFGTGSMVDEGDEGPLWGMVRLCLQASGVPVVKRCLGAGDGPVCVGWVSPR